MSTVRQSLAELIREGWIRSEPGRGFFVLPIPEEGNDSAQDNSGQGRMGFVWWYDVSDEPVSRPYITVMQAAANELKRHGIELVYGQFNPQSKDDLQSLSRFLSRMDGSIITGKINVDLLWQTVGEEPHVVLAGQCLSATDEDYYSIVESDAHSAGYMAVQHLASYGHRNLVLVAETGSLYSSHIRQGYKNACGELGLENTRDITIYDVTRESDESDSERQAHIRAVAEKIASCPDISAAVVAGNVHAERLIYHLQLLGCRVPDDISVVSVSGVPRTEMILHTISQVRIPGEQIGIECTRLLLKGKSKRIVHKMLPVRIDPGETVGPPRAYPEPRFPI